MPKGVEFVSWNAGAGVLDPERRVIDGDSESPLNKDFYTNLKAQAWWELRRRFERTHRAVTDGVHVRSGRADLDPVRPAAAAHAAEGTIQPTASKGTRHADW